METHCIHSHSSRILLSILFKNVTFTHPLQLRCMTTAYISIFPTHTHIYIYIYIYIYINVCMELFHPYILDGYALSNPYHADCV